LNGSPRVADVEGLPGLVVSSGGWRPEYADVIRDENLAALSIRISGDDLAFLGDLPHLRGLVLNAWKVRDLSDVEALGQLENLTLNMPSRPRRHLDFGKLPNLRSLGVYWNPGFESLFKSQNLELLWVFSPPDPDLQRFAELGKLKRLEFSQGRHLVSTRGVERLANLEFLGLYLQSALERLTDLSLAVGLRELEIETCKKLTTLEEISTLVNLRHLHVANCGEIASLRPLKNLHDLERFTAWESTNIVDGNLSVLTTLPRLRTIAMMSRRHYKPSVATVKASLAERDGWHQPADDESLPAANG
jgi:hypothetical protein